MKQTWLSTANPQKTLLLLMLVFAGIYSSISIVNHYVFRTYALDLGLYTNALYDYIRFRANDSTVFKTVPEHLLADHFDLHLIILSPLSFIFGTYTLLIVQISAILWGGYGVYKFISTKTPNAWLPVFAAAYFYSFFGVLSAVSFDYHSNVTAACLVPWLFYYAEKQNIRYALIFIFFILIAKENMALWLVFVLLGLAWMHRKSTHSGRFFLMAAFVSAILFLVITQAIMPAFSSEGKFPHFKYAILGETMVDALKYIITQPHNAFIYLFQNHTSNPDLNYIKIELHTLLFIAGMYILFAKPIWLFMLLPIFAQKLYHNDPTMWGLSSHYVIEFAPILSLGIFSIIAQQQTIQYKNVLVALATIGGLASSVRIMDKTEVYTDKNRIRFYKKEHYVRHYSVKEVYQIIENIPQEAVVSVQSPFLPHLALRDKVYQFPIIKDAEYIIVSEEEAPWPLSQERFKEIIDSLKISPNQTIIYDSKTVLVLKKH